MIQNVYYTALKSLHTWVVQPNPPQ